MRSHGRLIVRLVLLLAFTGLVAGFAASQYELVRSMVVVLCLSCMGVG